MKIDRFNSNEENQIEEFPVYKQGMEARKSGKTLSSNPYYERWARTFWMAGWCDQDIIEIGKVGEK